MYSRQRWFRKSMWRSGKSTPYQARNCIDRESELGFTSPEGILHTLSVLDIDARAIPFDDVRCSSRSANLRCSGVRYSPSVPRTRPSASNGSHICKLPLTTSKRRVSNLVNNRQIREQAPGVSGRAGYSTGAFALLETVRSDRRRGACCRNVENSWPYGSIVRGFPVVRLSTTFGLSSGGLIRKSLNGRMIAIRSPVVSALADNFGIAS